MCKEEFSIIEGFDVIHYIKKTTTTLHICKMPFINFALSSVPQHTHCALSGHLDRDLQHDPRLFLVRRAADQFFCFFFVCFLFCFLQQKPNAAADIHVTHMRM